jgi:hypothetical protein
VPKKSTPGPNQKRPRISGLIEINNALRPTANRSRYPEQESLKAFLTYRWSRVRNQAQRVDDFLPFWSFLLYSKTRALLARLIHFPSVMTGNFITNRYCGGSAVVMSRFYVFWPIL